MTSWLIRMWLLAMVAIPAVGLAATISGTVTDKETGEPMQLVSVSVGGEAYTTGTITTSSGDYVLNDVPAGRYVLRFSYIGYTTEVQTVFVGDETEREVDVAMEVDAIQLQEVEVVGDRFALEREIQTGYVAIGQKELMTVPSLGDPDPIRILQFMPGVQAASDISSGLYVRGGGPDQTLILLDQIPLYNPTHAFGLFSTFNADAIDRTTLYKGAYPAEFGGRLGAVLDVQNREGSNTGFKGKASVSTITGRVQAEGPLDKGSWLFGARRTYLEPLLSAIRSDDNQIPSYYFYDINGKLRLSAPGSDKLLFSFYTGRDNLRLDLDDDSFIGFLWGNTAASATFRRSFGPDLLGSVVISGSEYLSDTEVQIFSTPLSFANQLKDLSARSDLTWEPGGPHTVRFGLQASQYEFKYLQSFNKVTQLDLTQRPIEFAGYLQDEWRMTAGTNIRAGLRARYFSDGDRTFLEPRLSISQAVGPRVRLKLGAGLYNQVLQLVSTEGFSAGDFYVPIDQTANPSSSRQAVVGIDWNISQRYRLSVESYYTDLQDLLLLDNNVAVDQEGTATNDIFLTGGEGYATGIEVFLERRMGAVTGWIGYTWGRTRRKFDELNQGEVFPPKYDRRHDLNLVGSYRSGSWTFGAAFVYATGQAFTPAQSRYDIRNPATGELPADGALLPASRNSARLLPYHRLDVNVTKDASFFGLKGQWFVQVFNLYSRRNEWFIQYDTSNPDTEPEVVKQLPLIPNIGFTVDF